MPKTRTQLVQELVVEMGPYKSVKEYSAQLLARHGWNVHPSLIRKERLLLQKQLEERGRRELTPVNKGLTSLQAFAAELEEVAIKVAKVRALAEEVGGYDNLVLLAQLAKKIK